jgi:hypothetical protein
MVAAGPCPVGGGSLCLQLCGRGGGGEPQHGGYILLLTEADVGKKLLVVLLGCPGAGELNIVCWSRGGGAATACWPHPAPTTHRGGSKATARVPRADELDMGCGGASTMAPEGR